MMLPPTSNMSAYGNFPVSNCMCCNILLGKLYSPINQSSTSQEPQENQVDFKNLYIKNLDIGIKSADLFNLFKAFGYVVSARVMSNPQTGYSKGYGFVSYTSPVAASAALQEMNGRMVGSKPLVVAFHEPKKPKADKGPLPPLSESWSPSGYEKGPYLAEEGDAANIADRSFNGHKEISDRANGNHMAEPFDDATKATERMRDLDIGQQELDSSNVASAKRLQQKPTDKPRSLASLASGTSISPSPPSATPASSGYKVTPDGRPTLRRRNSLESVSSVVTESSTALKRQKMMEAVLNCGEYGSKTDEIVDMLLTLKRKDRSLCLFNEEFLREKIELALEALDAFDEEEDEEPEPYIPPSRSRRSSNIPSSEVNHNRANHRMSLPPNFAFVMPRNNVPEFSMPKRESKAIPIVAPPAEQAKPKPETKKPVVAASKEKDLAEGIDKFLESIQDKPLHEQKQQLGDRLFPLVKVR
jgi:hypothetical protein